MERHPYANNFRELIAYQKATNLAEDIFLLSNEFPVDEQYSLTRQIRRASRSIGAQIAEAWAKRFYKRHFISKLTDADAELNETEHWILTAKSCGYITEEKKLALVDLCQEIGRIIGGMIAKAESFCNHPKH